MIQCNRMRLRVEWLLYTTLLLLRSHGSILSTVHSFSIAPVQRHSQRRPTTPSQSVQSGVTSGSTALFGGTGIAKSYTWNEEQHEIEVKVLVPANTKTGDVRFLATSKSVHLSLLPRASAGGDGGGEEVLLDGKRALRGPIDADGTFWTIGDGESAAAESSREITVTIEKFQSIPKDQFEVYEYDWGGVYPNDEDEVISKDYKEAEPLDVREYAASLGVDIDNIDMSKVDKTMFTSGLNMTQTGMDELVNKGYATEVTAQADGTESVATDAGQQIPFRRLGDDVGDDEIRDAAILDGAAKPDPSPPGIPFIDTPSPWDGAAEAVLPGQQSESARGLDDSPVVPSASEDAPSPATKTAVAGRQPKPADPIDSLTVVKLKDILRKENLKVTGNKKELQDRLKAHVNSVFIKNKGDGGDVIDLDSVSS